MGQSYSSKPSRMLSPFFEVFASIWISAKSIFVKEPPEEQINTARDNLERCKENIEKSIALKRTQLLKVSKEAVACKRMGDKAGAKIKIQERMTLISNIEFAQVRLNRVTRQIDAIQTSELDKEVMLSLKASSDALKRAGVMMPVNEVETIVTELDEQIRDIQDTGMVLEAPVGVRSTEDMDLEMELERLMEEDEQGMLDKPVYTAEVAKPKSVKKHIEPVQEKRPNNDEELGVDVNDEASAAEPLLTESVKPKEALPV